MTYEEFEAEFGDRRRKDPARDQRNGQLWMNTLYEIRPDLYHAIMKANKDAAGKIIPGKHIDPFYQDAKLPMARQFAIDNW